MKKNNFKIFSVVLIQFVLVLLGSTRFAYSQEVLEGDLLISLIGKNKEYPEIKKILKSKEYRFSNKSVSNIYSSDKKGIYLQFNDDGLLICILLANEHYMSPFLGALPGGSRFNNILNNRKYEWRPNMYGTPMIGYYKDVRLKLCFKENGNISELHIEMPNNIVIKREPGASANDIKEMIYISDSYKGDFFCDIIGKQIKDPIVSDFLSDKNLNFSNRYDVKMYMSAEYGIKVYIDNDVVKSVYLSNNYEYGLLFKGLLPGNTSFMNVAKDTNLRWVTVGQSQYAKYKGCRLNLMYFPDKKHIQYLEIDSDISKLKGYYADDDAFPHGDEWLDYLARSIYDPKVENLLKCKVYDFVYDEYVGKYTSENRGVIIYKTSSGYVESILLLNDFEKKPPYKGLLPGNLTFQNILSNNNITFKPAGKSYVAVFDNYKLRLYSKDGKKIEYLAIDLPNRDALTKKYDGTYSKYKVYPEVISGNTGKVAEEPLPINVITDTCIKQYEKLGYTFVKKHSIRQVGGGGYYTTRCEWSMVPGSNYQIVFIYTKEGVTSLNKELTNNYNESLSLKTASSTVINVYKIEGCIVKTEKNCGAKLVASLFYSDDYKANRVFKDMDILVFRKSE